MKKEEFLKAFEEMSAEDQESIRAEIVAKGASREECCSGPMKEHLTEMMKKMKASEDPMAMCSEMMRMCCDMMGENSCA